MKLHLTLVPDDEREAAKRTQTTICTIEGEDFLPSQVQPLIELQVRPALYRMIYGDEARKEEERKAEAKRTEEAKKKEDSARPAVAGARA